MTFTNSLAITARSASASYQEIASRLDRGSLMVERYALQPAWRIATSPATRLFIVTLVRAIAYTLLALVEDAPTTEEPAITQAAEEPAITQAAEEPAITQAATIPNPQWNLKKYRSWAKREIGSTKFSGEYISKMGKADCVNAVLEYRILLKS